jgi:transcriptional regulator with GAF, ATPase, and Fis domain
VAQTTGRFQAADGGTLFLDEVGDLPLELQPKLLRVLQEKQVERLGNGRAVQVDVRVIAATNQDLWRMVQEKKFRADLFYRLNVFPIRLPPLRDRVADIPQLVEHFLQKFAKQQGKTIDFIPDGVMEELMNHDWPGNIRELQNVMECAVILSAGRTLTLHSAELRRQCAARPHLGDAPRNKLGYWGEARSGRTARIAQNDPHCNDATAQDRPRDVGTPRTTFEATKPDFTNILATSLGYRAHG